MRTLVAVAASVVALGLMTGCQVAPGVSPSVTVGPSGPTTMCTPTPSGSSTPVGAATPCTDAELSEQKRMDALYAEAEKVYRAFHIQDERLIRSGGLVDAEVLPLLAGPEVGAYSDDQKKANQAGITARGGAYRLVWIRPAPLRTFENSDVATESCVDASSMTGYHGEQPLGRGPILRGFTYYRMVEGNLRIWWRDNKEVSSC